MEPKLRFLADREPHMAHDLAAMRREMRGIIDSFVAAAERDGRRRLGLRRAPALTGDEGANEQGGATPRIHVRLLVMARGRRN